MNILIISTNRSASPVPVVPNGACMVAEAVERAGHSVKVLDLMFEQDPARSIGTELGRREYDVIGLSIRNIDNNDMQAPVFFIKDLPPLIDAVRKSSDAPIVLGGASLAVMPEEILRATGATCAVTGSGEVAFPRLLERMARRDPYADLPGVAVLEGGKCSANPPPSLPGAASAPDYDRWLNMGAYRSHLSTVPLQSKLGCLFQCVYCTYRKIEGSTYRLFEPEGVAEAALRLAAGLKDIEFVDNVFNAPYGHALSVCEALIRARPGARFQSVELNPAHFDHELLSAMERAGFVAMGITVESASDQVLAGLRKGFTAGEVYRTAEIVRSHRLPCLWIFLLGGPGETHDTIRETLRFAEKCIRPQDAAFFNIGIRVYPGTELETVARRQGLLSVTPGEMLSPVFYASPGVDVALARRQVKDSLNNHMNFMSGESFRFPHLPLIHQIGHRLGLRTPLWRYTRSIRRGLRFIGMDA
ncbi:MAG TPA: radical SAM protein [Bacteroidota bacterium]|nr:radical SAM protein [Bacteroidota bacterium]HXY55347.1 radical SAM protein [Nitrospirota bacterium]